MTPMPTAHTPAVELDADNPFAAPSPLPYALPDFAAITPAHIRAAVDAGLAAQRAEWEAIATDPATPDVANTLEALERSGQLLARVLPVLSTLVSSVGSEDLRALEREYAPRLAEHRDALVLDRRIFARLDSLHAARPLLDLDPETGWLLTTYRKEFLRAGILLSDADQERLRGLNARLVSLETEFGQRVVKGLERGALHVTDPAELAGLDEGTLAVLATAARERAGAEGYLVPLVLPSQHPLLARLEDRRTRARLLAASLERGSGTDPDSDTRQTLLDIARLRAERARLLGYDHHAAWVVEDGTAARAPTPSTRCSPGSRPPRPATPARRAPSSRGSWRPTRPSRTAPGLRPRTGPTTPNGCAGSASPSTTPSCAPTSSSTACSPTVSSSPPTSSTG